MNSASGPGAPSPETPSADVPAAPLARKVARRTTDLIVISLLTAAALTLGRSVVEWWRSPAEVPSVQSASGVDPGAFLTSAEPVLLKFGGFPVDMRQLVVRGDAEGAWSRLCELVGAPLKETSPALPNSTPGDAEPLANERRILEAAARETPVDASAAGAVYRFADQFAGAYAVRFGAGESREERVRAGRLVAWGLVLPDGAESWRIYEFERRSATDDPAAEDIDGPRGSVHILSLGNRTTGALTAFRGPGMLPEWKEHFASWFLRRGWELERDWMRTATTSSARYAKGPSERGEWADVRLVRSEQGQVSALVQFGGRNY